MDSKDERRAAGRLAGDGVAGMVALVADMHLAITGRVENHLPDSAVPVARTSSRLSRAVYSMVGAGLRATAVAGGELAARSASDDAPALSRSKPGRALLPVVNGLWGDTVEQRHPRMAIPMAIRVGGHDLPPEPGLLAAVFPRATSRVVVFLHGLAESEDAWWLGTEPDEPHPGSYGDRLRHDLGFTPVYLRYNAGLRVSENGRRASALLERIQASWPVPLEEIVLVGHSMGGLVSRSAAHYGDGDDAAWVASLSTVITLGTPHLGAPMEKGAHVVHLAMRAVPETEPLSRILGSRSVGVRDLRFGNIVEEDWHGHDPDEFLRDRSTEVPFVGHATYYFVASSFTRDIGHPAGRLFGDGMVRYPSASGRGRARNIPFEIDNGAHIGGVHHLSLLNHPDVYAQISSWLSEPDEVDS